MGIASIERGRLCAGRGRDSCLPQKPLARLFHGVQARVPFFSFSRPGPAGRRAGVRALTLLLCCATLAGFGALCKRRPEVPQALRDRYQADADRFCNAIVDCVKEDTARRLAAEPERRDMVLGRMSVDLCRENQYLLIGSLSADPLGPQPAGMPAGMDEMYAAYSRCSAAVAGAPNCAERRTAYQAHPDCARIRNYEPPES